MKTETVLLSVVMGVYNGEKYLKSAVQSVLDQTYKNFEFIIVDDASTDNTPYILQEFQDERIRVLRNEKNRRLPYSLNRGIREAKGKYIVRMDADDICVPNRFEKQVAYMEKHPKIGVAFGNVLCFSENGILNILDTNDSNAQYIGANMIFFNTVHHPAVIMRREIFETAAYNENYTVAEDMELWLKIEKEYPIKKTKECILLYRVHSKQVTSMYNQKQIAQEIEMKRPYLEALLGQISDEECLLHSKISARSKGVSLDDLIRWLEKLHLGNAQSHIYDIHIFNQVMLRLGMIVALYNNYFGKFIKKSIKEFGIYEVLLAILRMIKNIIGGSAVYIRNFAMAQKLMRKYEE